MRTFQVLSALLSYPEADILAACPDMAGILRAERLVTGEAAANLERLAEELAGGDPIALQERYVSLFDRGRNLSLHIFEHVHGESRDRGQAMVDLIEAYRRAGLALDARELPDYAPLFLEFLSQIDLGEAKALLADAMPVLSLLGARLDARGSGYAAVFDALEAIAGAPGDAEDIRARAAEEGADPTIVDMDRIWEEEAVTFMRDDRSCGARPAPAGAVVEAPIHWAPKPRGEAPGPLGADVARRAAGND